MKKGQNRSFRAAPDIDERLDKALELGLNLSQIINDLLRKHLTEALENAMEMRKKELEEQQAKLKAALATVR